MVIYGLYGKMTRCFSDLPRIFFLQAQTHAEDLLQEACASCGARRHSADGPLVPRCLDPYPWDYDVNLWNATC